MFVWLSEPNPQLTGHVWPNPVDEDAFMALLCYKNGSLTRFGWILSLIFSICQLSYNDSSRCHNAQIRERVRDTCAESSWSMFDELLNSTTRGNYGNLGLRQSCSQNCNRMYSLYFAGMYFDHPEIVPDGLLGDFRFNKSDEAVSRSGINNFLAKKITSKCHQVREQ